MGVIANAKETVGRFSSYIGRLTDLCKSNGISGSTAPLKLVEQWRSNDEFRDNWNNVWNELIAGEGRKITFTTVSLIIGAVLGGVGVAALGGAIGLPLAAVLAPIGYTVGNELDDQGLTQKFWRWIRRKEHRENDLATENEMLRQSEADFEALTITLADLSSRCECFDKKLVDFSGSLGHHDSRIATAEQRIVVVDRQVRILRWVSGVALALAVLAILGLVAKFYPIR
jgi:hypothetical protein